MHDGVPLPLGGPKQAAALAVLLLEHDRAIPLHRLVDLVWEADPPQTARRQVQNAMAAIRRRLAGHGADFLERIGDSYRFNAPDLDYRRFKADAVDAKAYAASGELTEAAVFLARALERWRGPVLANLRNARFEAFIQRLEEERACAVEDLIDVQLALGRFAPAIAQARSLLGDHPHREQTVRRVMLALHGEGRTAEALAAFQHHRSRLAEDLGTDPGDALWRTYEEILRGEADVPLKEVSVQASSRGDAQDHLPQMLAQLPAAPAVFVGREGEIAALDGLLDRTQATVAALTGLGGNGKTSIVAHWGHLRRGRFPDGQLYINLRGYEASPPLKPIEALRSLLHPLMGPGAAVPDTTDAAAALFRSLLADKQMLVVLDNARSAAQVRPLLPSGPDTVTIVTSRDRMQGLVALHDATPIHIGTLSQESAVELLTAVTGRRADAEAEAMRRIAELCDCSPLALRLAGANLLMQPSATAADFAARLSDDAERLELLAVQNDEETALTAVLDRTVSALDDSVKAVLWRLAAIPGEDFAVELAVSLGPGTAHETRRAIAAIVDCHLLERHRAGRYRFHDLTRLYTSKRQETELSDAERADTIDRFIDWHFRERRADEYVNLTDACRALADHPRIWRLTLALRTQIKHGFDLDLLHRLATHAKERSERLDDLDGLAQMQSFLSGVATMRGDMDVAGFHSHAAMDLVGEHGAGDEDGSICSMHGAMLYHKGMVREAEPYVARGAALAELTGRPGHLVTQLANLGGLCRRLSWYDEAEAHFLRAIALARRHGEITLAHPGLGLTYVDQGRYDEAEPIVEAALREATDRRAPRLQSITLFIRGELRLRRGDLDRARDDLERAVDIAGLHAIWNEFDPRSLLSKVLERQGDYCGARRNIEAVLADRATSRTPAFAAQAWLVAAEVTAAHDPHFALEHGARARHRFAAWRIPLEHGRSLNALALAQATLGEFDQAKVLATHAQRIFTTIGVPEARQASHFLDRLRKPTARHPTRKRVEP
ncbi:BTAD domain-containing putative transcriptional regulator [Glycomyces sp. NPDC046736]|uniref:AfsR/SARP family transcriptional regulator n=1 Tax=Glycomyces sp. NPDC046736 TaxID=3155615 RepID=UPI0033CF6ABF